MLICKWTCYECGVKEQKFFVRSRREVSQGQLEDITRYMNEISFEANASHSVVSPKCPSLKVDLYIPLADGNKGIGQE